VEETEEDRDLLIEPSELELGVLAEFSNALMSGQQPDLKLYAARSPEPSGRLARLMETAIWLKSEFDDLKRRYPGLRAWHLIGLPAKLR
jgi:hypothetical protein